MQMAAVVPMTGIDSDADEGVSEALLVRRARIGDLAAFEALYRIHQGRIYALCLRMSGSRDRAEDCMQEAFVQAWRRLPDFEGRSAFGTWLYRIAVNQVLTLQRKEGRSPDFLEIVDDLVAPGEDRPGSRDTGLAMDLEQAIASLPDGARNVFVLNAVHGYSHIEAAEMLGVAVGTCKAQLHRARRLLAERLDR
ncbi:MAG: RNA polymerase sigma factor [Gammaproteobacteria bacterium]